MAQLIVRNLEDSVKEKLRRRGPRVEQGRRLRVAGALRVMVELRPWRAPVRGERVIVVPHVERAAVVHGEGIGSGDVEGRRRSYLTP